MDRFNRPATTKLALSNDDWLLVKKKLSYGEQRQAFGRRYITGVDGRVRIDPVNVGMVTVTAYLLDWSLTRDGEPVPIRGISLDELTMILDNLEPEAFAEIRDAIERHEIAMAAEAEEAKKKTAGTPTSAPISRSPSAVAGGLSGSANSTPTSATSSSTS